MNLEKNQLQFLKQLFDLYFLNDARNEAFKLVATMYDVSSDFTENIESLLLAFWNKQND